MSSHVQGSDDLVQELIQLLNVPRRVVPLSRGVRSLKSLHQLSSTGEKTRNFLLLALRERCPSKLHVSNKNPTWVPDLVTSDADGFES